MSLRFVPYAVAALVLAAAVSVPGAGSPVTSPPPGPRIAYGAPSAGGGFEVLALRVRSLVDRLDAVDLPSDSAMEELSAGRFWHAALALRAEGMDSGRPEHVLLLAVAEAGWNNWPAVRELLTDAEWIERLGEGTGLFLLGRALERAERWPEAADAFQRYARVAPTTAAERPAAIVRGIRSLWRAGERRAAEAGLDHLEESPVVRSWLATDLIRETVSEGDTTATRLLLARVTDSVAREDIWRARADALLASGDASRAAVAFEDLAVHGGPAVGTARAAEASVELGRLRLASGDTAAARTWLVGGMEGAQGAARIRAAEGLLELGGSTVDEYLTFARLFDRAGDGRRALLAYDLAYRGAREAGDAIPDAARVERARLMGTVRARQAEALEEFRALRETVEDPNVAARNLQVWAAMRQRQGMDAQVATLRGWLVAEYPESSEAAEIVFTRGSNAESAGRVQEALSHYAAVMEAARTHDRAGQARMRVGQIHLGRGERDVAAQVFERYLEDFPGGRRWEEASYWAARVRLEMGDREAARIHVRRLMGQPISYYAVMAADLMEEPFAIEMSEGVAPEEPGWLSEGLARVDLLLDSELTRGVDAEFARLRDRARGSRAATLRLAEALIERGRTIDGINLGWELVDEGGWDRSVLRVTFPFPYRELVRREAEEWGVDPIMLAALIRQESAFKADIVSHAGAIGLMQVMPPTGAELARRHGPVGFSAEALESPEVNLHLGSAFLRDMTARYGGALPLVLSAYNAGPTRANRWRQFPEVVDELRFTERIPFAETRGYVKNIRRNLGLYRILYGEQ